MANPVRPGDRLGEPSGELRKLHIEHENLLIDLRPLERSEPALVKAQYEIRNDSSERDVELVFVGVDMEVGHYQVLFDGAPMKFLASRDEHLPKEWLDDSITLGDSRRGDLYESRGNTKNALHFTLHVTPGKHTIVVSYSAAVTQELRHRPVITWTCYYILAPAKRWASFGALDATVQLPEGWSAELTPAMNSRPGPGAFAQHWDALPADILSITTYQPTSWVVRFAEAVADWLGLVLFAAAAIAYGIWLGKRNSRIKRGKLRNVAEAMLSSVALTIAVCIAIMLVPEMLVKSEVGTQFAKLHYYGSFMIVLISPMLVVVSMVIEGVTGWIVYRARKPTEN
ncbi:MAG: hypothetical protein JSS75_04315 [Bacteroidetes bacterium]|nr:hypothetical protein [Bacteroidota bacterium]